MSKRVLILGGNRFFGRHLALALVAEGHKVTLLNRGLSDDLLGQNVERLKVDRKNNVDFKKALMGRSWDFVFDQICYTASDAQLLCEILKGNTEKIIFTSSQSVYGYGLDLKEEAFNPYNYKYRVEAVPESDYAEAKRQAEAVFSKFPELNPVMVRMPFVIGTDDYTKRLIWHIDKCRNGNPIYFPCDSARLGFIRSDMAGSTLLSISKSKLKGPVNCVCPGDISLSELMGLIGSYVGRSYIPAVSVDSENQSPYGIEHDWTMNTTKIQSAGIELPNLSHWLPNLLQTIIDQN